jgi:hypothetical protein
MDLLLLLTVATSIFAEVSLGISQMKCSSSSPAHRGISCQQEITLSAENKAQCNIIVQHHCSSIAATKTAGRCSFSVQCNGKFPGTHLIARSSVEKMYASWRHILCMLRWRHALNLPFPAAVTTFICAAAATSY